MATVDSHSAPVAGRPGSLFRLVQGAWLATLIALALWVPIVGSDLTSRARVPQLMVSDVLGRLATLELLTIFWLLLGLVGASLIAAVALPRSADFEAGQRAARLSMIAGSAGLAWVAPRALARGLLEAAPAPARLALVFGAVVLGALVLGWAAARSSARVSRLLEYLALVAWVLHWLVWPRMSPVYGLAVVAGAAGVFAVSRQRTIGLGRASVLVAAGILASAAICGFAQPSIHRAIEPGSRPVADGPDVVLFVVDTQRWDFTSLGRAGLGRASLGRGRDTTPNLEALASGPRATSFTAAGAAASATIPSVKSLFTSKASSTWGMEPAGWEPPPASAWTLARAFQESGYATYSLGTNGLLRGGGFETGFERFWIASGFDLYQRSFILNNLLSGGDEWETMRTLAQRRLHKVDGAEALAQFDEWLRRADSRPRFFYVHILEPHWPYYDHGRGFGSRVSPSRQLSHVDLHLLGREGTAALQRDSPEILDLTGRYEEELFAADLLLGRLLRTLERAGTDRDTLLVVTADHGEEFLEHGRFSHGYDIYREQIHVPLVIRWPLRSEFSAMPRQIDTAVSLLDVLPTLTELLGLARGRGPLDGKSLSGLLSGEIERPPVIAESFDGGTCRASVRQGDYKARLVFSAELSPLDTSEVDVFDLAADPAEERPLEEWNEEVNRLIEEARRLLHARWQDWPDREAGSTREPDGDPLDGLRDLGYVQ